MEDVLSLGMLIMLQAVLGIDNLLYISLESKHVVAEKQRSVRRWGIGLAIFLRIGLLFLLVSLIDTFKEPVFKLHSNVIEGEFNIHSLIVFVGGGFIIYTAMKEIWHMISFKAHGDAETKPKKSSYRKVLIMIIVMNLVFSFDSILSALALTNVLWVMITAIIFGGLLMIWLSDKVAEFLEKNRMYEVLGLFILFLVGVMLISEAGHLAEMKLLGSEITQMNKTTFYFIIAILVLIDVVQSKYQKKLLKIKNKNK